MAATPHSEDAFDLGRFVNAQENTYAKALAEIKLGNKQSHWMWFIFPQIAGLGYSSTSKYYAIKSIEEARAYLNHPILGVRLKECMEAAEGVQGCSAYQIFGSPDDMKLKSCATLFAEVAPPESVFERVLVKYFKGAKDDRTLQLLEKSKTSET